MKSLEEEETPKKKVGFGAYDGDVFQTFTGNFGVSYQDLSTLARDEPSTCYHRTSPLIETFLRRKRRSLLATTTNQTAVVATAACLNLDVGDASIFKSQSSSVPDLLEETASSSTKPTATTVNCCVQSVPKDLNLIGVSNSAGSVAEKDLDLAQFRRETSDVNESSLCSAKETKDASPEAPQLDQEATRWDLGQLVSDVKEIEEEEEMACYKREGSYEQAMANRVDLSDDENSLRYRKKLPKTPIVEFDRRVLKAISEQSIQSILNSTNSLHQLANDLQSTPVLTKTNMAATSAVSTPNLNKVEPMKPKLDEDRRKSIQNVDKMDQEYEATMPNFDLLLGESRKVEKEAVLPVEEQVMLRKGSIIKSSTSTSGMSDEGGERTIRNSVKSFTGSTGSKGVHFSPVVSEVNWRDDASASTVTPERESSYSLNTSSSPSPERELPPKIVKPKARYGTPVNRRTVSQPDLSDTDSCIKEFKSNLQEFTKADVSKSQPDMHRLNRRGSKLVKRTEDGAVISAYVDRDGVQYQHTHLDISGLGNLLRSPTTSGGSVNSLLSSSQQSTGSRTADGRNGARAAAGAGANMEAERARKVVDRGGGKLGGFFSRLASFRFSSRNKEKARKKQDGGGGVHKGPTGNQQNTHQPRVATKDDYIFIPLKGPLPPATPTTNNNNSITSKPPLPKQPPRVVHASAKQQRHQPADGARRDDFRYPPIDGARGGAIDSRRMVGGLSSGADAVMEASGAPVVGLIETDLDTEVTVITDGKTRSLLDLGPDNYGGGRQRRPHKSMEFLLDKQNLKVVEPPENELQKGERVLSEHQLRVQRSLQKLHVPDWYRQNAPAQREGFLLAARRHHQQQSPRETRWQGTGAGSKTTSLSSLASSGQSPLVLSPTPTSHSFVRWSTSKLNSTASSPCQSTRASFNATSRCVPNGGAASPAGSARSSFSYRQPYLGWRSQERLSRPRTPAERLASSILDAGRKAGDENKQTSATESPEIQTSIKEVTSAIVHYVSALRPDERFLSDDASHRSSSASPRGSSQRLCWLESSFVGSRPPDSPQTPVASLPEANGAAPGASSAASGLRLDLRAHNGESLVA